MAVRRSRGGEGRCRSRRGPGRNVLSAWGRADPRESAGWRRGGQRSTSRRRAAGGDALAASRRLHRHRRGRSAPLLALAKRVYRVRALRTVAIEMDRPPRRDVGRLRLPHRRRGPHKRTSGKRAGPRDAMCWGRLAREASRRSRDARRRDRKGDAIATDRPNTQRAFAAHCGRAERSTGWASTSACASLCPHSSGCQERMRPTGSTDPVAKDSNPGLRGSSGWASVPGCALHQKGPARAWRSCGRAGGRPRRRPMAHERHTDAETR